MNRPKFVRVVGIPEPRAGKDGRFRKEGDLLKVGTVVPVEWFEDTPDAVFWHLMNPIEAGGMAVLEESVPGTAELAVLRDQYPTAFTEPPAAQETKKTRNSKQEEGE